jgi:hypothetical protein
MEEAMAVVVVLIHPSLDGWNEFVRLPPPAEQPTAMKFFIDSPITC